MRRRPNDVFLLGEEDMLRDPAASTADLHAAEDLDNPDGDIAADPPRPADAPANPSPPSGHHTARHGRLIAGLVLAGGASAFATIAAWPGAPANDTSAPTHATGAAVLTAVVPARAPIAPATSRDQLRENHSRNDRKREPNAKPARSGSAVSPPEPQRLLPPGPSAPAAAAVPSGEGAAVSLREHFGFERRG